MRDHTQSRAIIICRHDEKSRHIMDRHWNVVNEIIYYSISLFFFFNFYILKSHNRFIIFLRAQPILIAALKINVEPETEKECACVFLT